MPRAPHRNRRSWLALLLGAFSLGTGLAWMLAAAWGVAPLDAFIAGASELTGLTIGTVIIVISLFFVAAAWLLGSRPGIGTPIAFVGVGVVVDVWNIVIFDALSWMPADWAVAARVVTWIVGFALFAGGVIATLASDLGANPYDQIVRVVHEKFGISLALSRLAFDGVILLGAFLIGGAWGVGTVAILVLMPIAMGSLTPRLRGWVHSIRDHEPENPSPDSGAIKK
jgi:uncharacterized membrane protein YczE